MKKFTIHENIFFKAEGLEQLIKFYQFSQDSSTLNLPSETLSSLELDLNEPNSTFNFLSHKSSQLKSISNYKTNVHSITQGQTFSIWNNKAFNWNFFIFQQNQKKKKTKKNLWKRFTIEPGIIFQIIWPTPYLSIISLPESFIKKMSDKENNIYTMKNKLFKGPAEIRFYLKPPQEDISKFNHEILNEFHIDPNQSKDSRLSFTTQLLPYKDKNNGFESHSITKTLNTLPTHNKKLTNFNNNSTEHGTYHEGSQISSSYASAKILPFPLNPKGPKKILTEKFIKKGKNKKALQNTKNIKFSSNFKDTLENKVYKVFLSLKGIGYKVFIFSNSESVDVSFRSTDHQNFIPLTSQRTGSTKKFLNFKLGQTHPINVQIPSGITAISSTDRSSTLGGGENQFLTLIGKNKETLTQFASLLVNLRPPEPYKGKGILIRTKKHDLRRQALQKVSRRKG